MTTTAYTVPDRDAPAGDYNPAAVARLRARDRRTIDAERGRGDLRARLRHRQEAADVAAYAEGIDRRPWDPALLPPSDPEVTAATERLLAAERVQIGADAEHFEGVNPTSTRIRWEPVGAYLDAADAWEDRHADDGTPPAVCHDARALVTERTADDGAGGTVERYAVLEVGCRRSTCPNCRPYVRWRQADRILRTFAGAPMYAAELATGHDWDAAAKRVTRRDGAHVGIAAPGGRRVMLATVPPTPDARPLDGATRKRAVERITDQQPLGKTRITGTQGFLAPERPKRADDPGRVVGIMDNRAAHRIDPDTGEKQPTAGTVAEVERVAADVGLPTTRLRAPAGSAGVQLDAHPRDPRVEALWVRVGGWRPFTDAEAAAATRDLADGWDADPYLTGKAPPPDRDPPAAAYRDPLTGEQLALLQGAAA